MRKDACPNHAALFSHLWVACVKLPDTMRGEDISGRRAAEIRRRLERNRRRREKARTEVDKARDELAALLMAGREAGLDVKGMSAIADVSRETAHQLLRRS
jgi:hypothetical protein